MYIQASEYERDQGILLQEFFDSTAGRFKTATGQAWAAEVVARRTRQQQEKRQQGASQAQSGSTGQ